MRSRNSAWLLALRSCTVIRDSPPIRKWTWESLKPGNSRRPWRSTIRVEGPANFRMSSSSPTARIVGPSRATARATGCAGFSVHTFPLTRIKLACCAAASQQKVTSIVKTDNFRRNLKKPPKGCRTEPAGKKERATNLGLVALQPAVVRRGRSDRRSSPCSTPPRSLSRTSPSSRHMHRLQRPPGAGSWNRRRGRCGCRSI